MRQLLHIINDICTFVYLTCQSNENLENIFGCWHSKISYICIRTILYSIFPNNLFSFYVVDNVVYKFTALPLGLYH